MSGYLRQNRISHYFPLDYFHSNIHFIVVIFLFLVKRMMGGERVNGGMIEIVFEAEIIKEKLMNEIIIK